MHIVCNLKLFFFCFSWICCSLTHCVFDSVIWLTDFFLCGIFLHTPSSPRAETFLKLLNKPNSLSWLRKLHVESFETLPLYIFTYSTYIFTILFLLPYILSCLFNCCYCITLFWSPFFWGGGRDFFFPISYILGCCSKFLSFFALRIVGLMLPK